MNAQFHTPSFGDEVIFDLPDNETDCETVKKIQGGAGIYTTASSVINKQYQEDGAFHQENFETKRIRNMDMSMDEYHSANDESFANTAYTVSPTKNAQNIPTATLAARKQLAPTATDANEPAKPLSAYGLFFRDTVSTIKQQNPDSTFHELSRIVSSMWEALDVSSRNLYNTKHEAAMVEYRKQMRIYRQQQNEQQEQLSASINTTPVPALQTKPAVFTISRYNNADDNSNNTSHNNVAGSNETSVSVAQSQVQLAIPTSETNSTANDPPQPQIQMLSEAGAVQKCTRENCNKRAIINPDWEDEYCSNECVVIHCRNVFNAWVQSNLESRKQ